MAKRIYKEGHVIGNRIIAIGIQNMVGEIDKNKEEFKSVFNFEPDLFYTP